MRIRLFEKMIFLFHRNKGQIKNETNKLNNAELEYKKIKEIIIEEKYRLGTPDSNLLAENIIYRINELIRYESNKND